MPTDKQVLTRTISALKDRAISPRLPVWILEQPYSIVEHRFQDGYLTPEQWSNYRAVWRYSAPRFSNLVPDSECPRVSDAWAMIRALESGAISPSKDASK